MSVTALSIVSYRIRLCLQPGVWGEGEVATGYTYFPFWHFGGKKTDHFTKYKAKSEINARYWTFIPPSRRESLCCNMPLSTAHIITVWARLGTACCTEYGRFILRFCHAEVHSDKVRRFQLKLSKWHFVWAVTNAYGLKYRIWRVCLKWSPKREHDWCRQWLNLSSSEAMLWFRWFNLQSFVLCRSGIIKHRTLGHLWLRFDTETTRNTNASSS
jgi:hypothetical protein